MMRYLISPLFHLWLLLTRPFEGLGKKILESHPTLGLLIADDDERENWTANSSAPYNHINKLCYIAFFKILLPFYLECVNQARRFNRCSCERLPPVPKRSDPAPLSYPPSQENYINYNSKHVADVANYHEPKLQVVDSKDGHTMDLEKSGLVPHFITKPVNQIIF